MTREDIISLIKSIDVSGLCGCTVKQEDNLGSGMTQTLRVHGDRCMRVSEVDTGEQIVKTTVYEFAAGGSAYILSSFSSGDSVQRLKKLLTPEQFALRKSGWRLSMLSAVLGGAAVGNPGMPNENFSDLSVEQMDGMTMITYCLNCSCEGTDVLPTVALALKDGKLIAMQGGYTAGKEVMETEWSPIYEQQPFECPDPDEYSLIDDLDEGEKEIL